VSIIAGILGRKPGPKPNRKPSSAGRIPDPREHPDFQAPKNSQDEVLKVKQEMDAWIRRLRQEIRLVADEGDDLDFEVRKQADEIRFNYENIAHLTERIDRLEEAFAKLAELVEPLTAQRVSANIRPLPPKG